MSDFLSVSGTEAQRFSGYDIGNERDWRVLVVSSALDNRNALTGALRGLVGNIFVASTIKQAREVLASTAVDIIFCEESLPDGSYRHLLEPVVSEGTAIFVVTLRTGEWNEYLEAMRLGATDVLRCPVQATEVGLVLVRAGREQHRQNFDAMA